MPVETTRTSDDTPAASRRPSRKQGKGFLGGGFAKSRWRFLSSVFLLALIIWMAFETLSTWVVHTWLPAIVPIEKIEKDIQNELARATQLEPLWEKWNIEPTLFNGLRISVEAVQLRENPDFLKERGVAIPTPKDFRPPVKPLPKTVAMGNLAQSPKGIPPKTAQLEVRPPAMAKVRRFELYFRYWPLISRQHFQISRIQLSQVRLLGGASGVLTHYFPVFYDAEYGKKYFKKKDPPTYLSDATFGVRDLGLYQIGTSAVMKAVNPKTIQTNASQNAQDKQDKKDKQDERKKPDPKTVLLPVERVGIDIQDGELTHLVSKKPLALRLKGRFGVFRESDKTFGGSDKFNVGAPSQELDDYYDRWNRVFSVALDSRITGDNPDKAFSGPWGEADLQNLEVRILSPADAPESLFLKTAGHKGIVLTAALKKENKSKVNKSDGAKNASANFSPYFHDWQFEANALDLSLLSDTFRSLQSLIDQEIGRSLMPFALRGKITTRLKGKLLWEDRPATSANVVSTPALLKTPVARFDDGYISARDVSLAYQQPSAVATVQSVNVSRQTPDTFLLDSFNGVATLKDYLWQLDNAAVVLGKSKMLASANWYEKSQAFNASLRGENISLETLLAKFSKLEPVLAKYQPNALTPEAKKMLAQWRRGELKLTGLLDFNLAFNGNTKNLANGAFSSRPAIGPNGIDYRGNIAFTNGNLISNARGNANVAVDVQNVAANVDIGDKVYLRKLTGRVFETPFSVSGEADKLFSQYSAQVQSHDINLQKIHRLFKQQLPPSQAEALAALEDIQGSADVALSYVHSGNNSADSINGTLQVLNLALTPDLQSLSKGQMVSGSKIEFGKIPVVFDGQSASLARVNGKWGPIPLDIEGKARWGSLSSQAEITKNLAFDATLKTGNLPISIFRENDRFFRALLKDQTLYPHFWNTSGALALNAQASKTPGAQQANLEGALSFYDAGASWREGDFPVYNVNGQAMLTQVIPVGNAGKMPAPVISTENLEGRYGNSPIAVMVDMLRGEPELTVRGRLSPLTLNHYLTAPQATYAPYQMVPFRLELARSLRPELPPGVYGGRLFMGLNRLLVAPPEENTDTLTLPPDRYRRADRSRLMNETLSRSEQSFESSPLSISNKKPEPVTKTADTETERQPQAEQKQPPQFAGLSNDLSSQQTSQQPPAQSSQTPSAASGQRAFILAEFGVNPNAVAAHAYPFFRLYPSQLHLSNYGDLLVEGALTRPPKLAKDEAFDWRKLEGGFHLLTSPLIDIKGIGEHFRSDIFKDADGKVSADVRLDLNPRRSDAARTLSGWVKADKIALPLFYVDDISGQVVFEQQRAAIDLSAVKFQGADLIIHAESAQALHYPIPLENVKIGGKTFDLPAIQQFNAEVVGNIVENVVRKFSRPWQEGDPLVPVEFKDADVNIDEVVYQNIILENLKGKLTVLGNSFTQLADTEVDLAGGKVSGYIEMNPFDNNFLSVNMKTEGVSANALTRAMLGVTNQVFGDVDAQIRYQTQGKSENEMLENANGTVKLKIANGRLPALSTVETLLTAANIIRGGILGFNFNNLIRAITPFRARYFADLSGDMEIAEKRLHTKNLLLDGENLDLLMKGTVTMDDGQADMMIDGSMNQTVSSGLGFIGKLSPGNLLRIIPILGFNPFGKIGKSESEVSSDEVSFIADPGLLYRIPGLGYIPGLGGPVKDVSRFRIKMQGPPQDQASIKSFTWLTEKDLEQEKEEEKAAKKAAALSPVSKASQ